MKNKKRIILLAIVTLLMLSISAIALTACDRNEEVADEQSEVAELSFEQVYAYAQEAGYTGTLDELIVAFNGDSAYQIAVNNGYTGSETEWLLTLVGASGKDGANGITPHIGENDNWFIGDIDTGVCARGKDGANGVDGKDGADGKDGSNGENGKDGLTPYIGENGNWWIGEADTAIKAAGTDGINGTAGANGADGKNGNDGTNGTDGVTPHIGENGNWWIGETDTGVKAAGTAGKDGVDGKDGVNGTNGINGVGISKIEINDDGELVISYTDGTNANLGKVKSSYGHNVEEHEPVEEEYIVKEATCCEKGLKQIYCATCGELIKTVVIPQVTHHEYEETVTAPTDTENGKVMTKCKWCGFIKEETKYNLTFTKKDSTYYEVSKGTTNLTKVVIHETYKGLPVTSIAEGAFSGCKNLTSIEIPEGITSIGKNAFNGCVNLTNVQIPTSVNSIGDSAFYNCYKLVEVCNLSSLCIVKGSTSNGYVGYYAKGIYTTKDYVSKLSVDSEGYMIYTNGMEKILIGYQGDETELALPNDITNICQYAFYKCKSLISIEIPASVTSIREHTFEKCSNLTSIEIPVGVTSIGDSAFYECSSLTSVEIPASVTSIGSSAFNQCSNLTSVEIPASVTSIGGYAFCNCRSLTSIVIPASVTSIGDYAFYNCFKLVEVCNLSSLEITKGSKDNGYIGNSAKDIYTTKDYVSKLSVDSEGCIIYTDETENILLGYKGDKAALTIPSGITSIYQYAFYYCYILTSIEIPASVTSIGDSAFYECSNLTSVTFVEGSQLTSIGNNAFRYCCSLRSIVIPASVTSIGSLAFNECNSLIGNFYYDGTEAQWALVSKGSNWNLYYYDYLNRNFAVKFTK